MMRLTLASAPSEWWASAPHHHQRFLINLKRAFDISSEPCDKSLGLGAMRLDAAPQQGYGAAYDAYKQ